jgi:UDP-N-acetylmuramyl pentapeptide phosphotransferase/UDP-N-acetylglucosamine-1-phosphate transferase
MGDTGSLTLGLTVAFLAISYVAGDPETSTLSGNLSVAFSVVLVPVLDAVRVILIRFFAGKPIFLPDKNHIHHYFLDLGFSKQTTLFFILSIALGFIVLNMCIVRFVYNNQTIVMLLDLTLWFGGLWLLGKVRHSRLRNSEKIPVEKSE